MEPERGGERVYKRKGREGEGGMHGVEKREGGKG